MGGSLFWEHLCDGGRHGVLVSVDVLVDGDL